MDWLSAIGSGDFMPHGHCYLWIPGLVWLQVLSNFAIGSAYVAISGTLVALTRKLQGIPFHGIYLAFGLFIISCGLTHFMDILTVWKPVYWVDGGIRAFTAVASVGTAVYLATLSPRVLALGNVLLREREVSRSELERLIGERDELLARESTARREAEDRGRLFRALVENLPDLAWTAQPDGHIDFYNQRWYDYTGTTFAEMQGWGWEKVHDAQVLPLVVERWNRSLQTGEPFEMEFPLRGRDGSFRWFLTRIRPIRDEGGRILRWFGSNTDIHESKKAAEEREQLLVQLTNSVRFSELFVGILGHDLRNPLSAISTSGKVLLRRSNDERIVTPSRRIVQSAERMARMIDQILDFTRARLGAGFTLQPKEVSLVQVLENSRDELQAAFPDAAIRIDAKGDGRGFWDEDRLAQVASNLFGNAIQHRVADKTVTVQVDGTQADSVLWSVHNDGVIPAAVLPVLFEPFRGSTHKTEKSRGLGLGLYITQQMVAAHGGQISVETDERAGTTFTVRLPRRAPGARE